MSEINVTPFVDVMLVLLIVFMVTEPLLTVGIHVDLPKVKTSSALTDQKDPIKIFVKYGDDVLLNDSKIEVETLKEKLDNISNINTDARIYLWGDKNVGYGRIMEIMDAIKKTGYNKIAIVTQTPSD